MGFSTHTPLPWAPLMFLLPWMQAGSPLEQAATDSSPQTGVTSKDQVLFFHCLLTSNLLSVGH